jgi:hypothetical protein
MPLRKYKRNGVLLTAKVNGDIQLKLRKVLVDDPMGLLSKGGDFELIVDTGCTKTATGFESNFVPGTLTDLEHPIRMDGIAGGLNIRKEGKVKVADFSVRKHTSSNCASKEKILNQNVK